MNVRHDLIGLLRSFLMPRVGRTGWMAPIAVTFVASFFLSIAAAADVEPAQLAKMLSRAAKQKDVDFDKTDPADYSKCTGKYETRNGVVGLLISGPSGEPIRWLADTNGDKKIDQISFYGNGVEVYRDIDSDFNDKIDQSRWMGTSGMRWGIDRDEDGVIDDWKAISAEEVTSEVVAALRESDSKRLERLMLTNEELSELGLGQQKTSDLKERIAAAPEQFQSFLTSQKVIDPSSRWVNFGADKPGVVPAGTQGSTSDVLAYENVMAVVETSTAAQQVLVGTLIRVGDRWRIIDVPKLMKAGIPIRENGLFFASAEANRMAFAGGAGQQEVSAAMEKLLKEMEILDAKLQDPASDRAVVHAQRATLYERLIAASNSPEDLQTWIHQMADQIFVAVQSGDYPEGIERLKRLEASIQRDETSKQETSYVAYRILGAEYTNELSDKDVNFESVQKSHLEKLEAFINAFPKSSDSADAMIQLGFNSEVTGDEKSAAKWYERIVKNYPATPQGNKAAGALARLMIVGRPVFFEGVTLEGKALKLAALKRPVIVHYWASNVASCKADMQRLQRLRASYGSKGLAIVGINLDTDKRNAIEFLKENKDFNWDHLYEAGGMDSKLAVDLGVLSLPVTILLNEKSVVLQAKSNLPYQIEDDIVAMLPPAAPPKK